MELDKHRSPTASSKLPNNKYNFETEINLQSLYVDKSQRLVVKTDSLFLEILTDTAAKRTNLRNCQRWIEL